MSDASITSGHQPFDINEPFPDGAPASDQLRFLLRYAILAPSIHNTQPWTFSIDDATLSIRVDKSRWLVVADQDQRELHISLGCALESLIVAIEHFGLGHRVECLPDPHDPLLVATVELLPDPMRASYRTEGMFRSITRRATAREPYAPEAIADDHLAGLRSCVAETGPKLLLLGDQTMLREIDALVITADALLFSDRAYREELGHWIGVGSFGASPLRARLEQLAVASLNLGSRVARHDSELMIQSAMVGVITSAEDDHLSHLKVGRLFERVALAATAYGIGVQPMTSLVEVSEIREMFAKLLPAGCGYPQHPFRLGYLTQQQPARSPRRPIDEVLSGSPGTRRKD